MKNITTLFSFLIFVSMACSCNKKADKINTLEKLYTQYEDGQISECTYEGKNVFSCGRNNHDAGGAIYNLNGKLIGTCNYGWGTPDEAICGELEDCVIVYCVEDNIWGNDPVDKYELN